MSIMEILLYNLCIFLNPSLHCCIQNCVILNSAINTNIVLPCFTCVRWFFFELGKPVRVVVAEVVALPCRSVGFATRDRLLALDTGCPFSPLLGLRTVDPCGVDGLLSLDDTLDGTVA